MSDHARLSPSSSDRWVVCQESLIPVPEHLRIPREEDEFAADGSAKHKLSEWCLSNDAEPIEALLAEMEFHKLKVTAQMVEAASIYVDYVNKLSNVAGYEHRWLESRVYMEDIDDEMYGTLDCAIFSERFKHLIIGDAKFGWEIRQPDIWQLRCYAVGKVRELEDLGYEIEKVTCFICQPPDEFEPVKSIEYTREQITAFAKHMKRVKKGNAVKAGEHCARCPRSHFCEAFERYAMEAIEEAFDNPVRQFNQLTAAKSPDEVSTILKRQAAVNAWFAAMAGWAKQLILLGGDVPGYEVRQGKGNRVYTDPDYAEQVLLARYGEGVYEPKTLRSPAQIEDIWKKDAKILLNGTKDEPGLTHRPVKPSQLVRIK